MNTGVRKQNATATAAKTTETHGIHGLVEGDRVILHPPNRLTDGMRVRAE
jgi:hypothetical protein